MTIDDETLDELERCAEAATDEDWEVLHGPGVTEIAAGTFSPWGNERETEKVIASMRANPSPDAEHIATADPPTVLALVQEVRRLREALQYIRDFPDHEYTDEMGWIACDMQTVAERALEADDE